ncbi:hypothetical protein ACIBKY_07195 [Nonomuraea sp. NPDC050394]|uniref:hypothetical protein n=1 Tax=Nonomuraea sp. NPDC050394 TaxID=3364363 RepID=UPI0037B14291
MDKIIKTMLDTGQDMLNNWRPGRQRHRVLMVFTGDLRAEEVQAVGEGGVVHRGTLTYDEAMKPTTPPTEVSVRQFVNDSGSVTRGLREGKRYILTINGEPLAEVKPIRRRRFVPTAEAQATFAAAPAIDWADVRAEWDDVIDDSLRDPFEGTEL